MIDLTGRGGEMSKRVRKFVKLLKSAYLVGDTSAAVGARALRVVEGTMRTCIHTGIEGCSSVVGGVCNTLSISKLRIFTSFSYGAVRQFVHGGVMLQMLSAIHVSTSCI